MRVHQNLAHDICRQSVFCISFVCLVSLVGLSFRAFLASNTPSLYLNHHYPLREPLSYLTDNSIIYFCSIAYTILAYRTHFLVRIARFVSNFYLSCFLWLKSINYLIPSFILCSAPLLPPFLIFYYWSSPPSVYNNISLSIVDKALSLIVLWRPKYFKSKFLNVIILTYLAACALALSFISGRQSTIVFLICLLFVFAQSLAWLKFSLLLSKRFLLRITTSLLIGICLITIFVFRTFNRDLQSFNVSTFSLHDIVSASSYSFSMHDSEVFIRDYSIKGSIANFVEQLLIFVPRSLFPNKPDIYGISLSISHQIYSNSIANLVLDFQQGTTSAGLSGTLFYVFGDFILLGASIVPLLFIVVMPMACILKQFNQPLFLYLFLSLAWQIIFRGVEIYQPSFILVFSVFLAYVILPNSGIGYNFK